MTTGNERIAELLRRAWKKTFQAREEIEEIYELVFGEKIQVDRSDHARKWKPVATTMLGSSYDPYERVEPGREFGDNEEGKSRYPKWMEPTSDFQKSVLTAAGRKRWPTKEQDGKTLRSAFVMIEKSMSSISENYPTAWVENCLDWFKKKNSGRPVVHLRGLLSLINDEDRKNEFMAKRREKKPDGGDVY